MRRYGAPLRWIGIASCATDDRPPSLKPLIQRAKGRSNYPSPNTAMGADARSLAIQSAPASRRVPAGRLVVNPRHRQPAAFPALIPLGASSTTMHSEGSQPTLLHASRKMSGAGFFLSTSSPFTVASNVDTGKPISRRLPSSLTRSALVATANFRPRRLDSATNPATPPRGLRRPLINSRRPETGF